MPSQSSSISIEPSPSTSKVSNKFNARARFCGAADLVRGVQEYRRQLQHLVGEEGLVAQPLSLHDLVVRPRARENVLDEDRDRPEALGAVAQLGRLAQGLAEADGEGVERHRDQDRGPEERLEADERSFDHHHQFAEKVQAAKTNDSGDPDEPHDPEQREVRVVLLLNASPRCHRQDHLQDNQNHGEHFKPIPLLVVACPERPQARDLALHQELDREHDGKGGVDPDPTIPLFVQVAAHSDHNCVQDDEDIGHGIDDEGSQCGIPPQTVRTCPCKQNDRLVQQFY
mmetsp:Transcript_137006/g.438314  ORF Transcript_137006/g.438314 Transcript_137006/m.438314 type:complete len:285 (-) Transcript_137006:581-1435(-)